MRRRRVGLEVILLSLWCGLATVHAQGTDQPATLDPAQTTERPVELLMGIDDLTSVLGRGQDARLTASIPMSERMAFELFGGAYRGNEEDFDISAVAGFQFRQRLMRVRRPDQELFTTYGAVFLFGDERCTGASCGKQRGFNAFGLLGTLGFGFQQSITSRLAIRAEAQAGFVLFIPVGVRVAAAVAIPLGRMRVPRADF